MQGWSESERISYQYWKSENFLRDENPKMKNVKVKPKNVTARNQKLAPMISKLDHFQIFWIKILKI